MRRRLFPRPVVAAAVISFAFALVARAAESAGAAPAPSANLSGAAILQDLRSFNTVATLLHIAAHPDDENTQLITYFARGRGYRTAYLSLTRGDGGQNEIGPEFGEKLGVARTQELLAARRLDGGRQFFTRAIDFGFSKNAEETLRFWDRDQVLGDVVRVIRQFRPDVIVTRFAPGSSGSTHGHHTASGMLGVEAFRLAGDPKAYPEQLAQGLTVWQPKRVALNVGSFGGTRANPDAANKPVRVDIGGADPVTGEPLAAIANRSRGMHITQGFGNFGARGGGGGPNEQTFVLLGGEPAEQDLFDGVDTTWARVPGGAAVGAATSEIITAFKTDDPAASVPALLALRRTLAVLPADPVIGDKRAQLDRIVVACLGLRVQSITSRAEVVPGERFAIDYEVISAVPVKLVEVRSGDARATHADVAMRFGGNLLATVPANTPPTQPYWLRDEPAAGLARVGDPRMIGRPENPAEFVVDYVFEFGGERLTVSDDAVAVLRNGKERRRRVDVVPPVSLRFGADVSLVRPGGSRAVVVDVLAARAGAAGELELGVPAGWRVSPAKQTFEIAAAGESARLAFELTAPAQPGTGRVTATAVVGGRRFSHQRIVIDYPHLPPQLLQPPAQARLVSADIATRGKAVGYLPGAGDDTAQALEQLGYAVKTLTGADLSPEKLRGLDAVVIGVRAFNERRDLAANLPGLFAWVEAGGTVIAQYNRPTGALRGPLAPFELSIAGAAPPLRVTDETASVTFLAPEHPALNGPNKIGAADFDGWVQERGAYFPSAWDKRRFESLFAMSDPGEQQPDSSVLVARHGQGYYVYTGLAFFRQLPAGVPGAYRLFANLVSLGQ